jgi:hypothetical protein
LTDVLIGSTGFVGGHLARQHDFGALLNSRNITDSSGSAFDTCVCAAAPGSMFLANRFPEADRARIETLKSNLAAIKVERFVLVSTIAVFDDFCAADESDIRHAQASAYGRHRRDLELFCAARFPRCLVVRLPALFGAGLKKNFLFDILNPMPAMLPGPRLEAMAGRLDPALSQGLAGIYAWDDALGLFVINREALEAGGRRRDYDAAIREIGFAAELFTSPQTRFQFYDMSRLWSDIVRCLAAGVDLVHLATAPLSAAHVYATLTGRPMPASEARVHREDMRTRYAALWGHAGPYIETEEDVLSRLTRFFAEERPPA